MGFISRGVKGLLSLQRSFRSQAKVTTVRDGG